MTQPTFTVPITVVVRTVTGQDSYHNDVFGETVDVVDGVFAPGLSSELLAGRDQVTVQPTAYLPGTVNPHAVDALEVGGVRYEIDGEPSVWPPHPYSGWVPALPVVVPLKRVEG